MSAEEYKAKWGYPRGIPLRTPHIRDAARHRASGLSARPPVPPAVLAGLQARGLSIHAIARAVGLDRSTVRRRLRELRD